MAIQIADARHRIFRDDLIALLKKHSAEVSAAEALAIAAHAVGQLIALQDQRTMTADTAMEIVFANIEHANAEALAGLGNPSASA